MLWILTVFIAIFTLVVEIFTIVFMLTGLSHKKSKFQVISMLTSTGFTTRESEVIMLDSTRRRYAQILIVFGYCASVTIVSMLVSSINTENNWYEYLIALTVTILFILLVNNKKIRKKIDPKIHRFGAKLLYGSDHNYLTVLETLNDKIVAKVMIANLPKTFEKKTMEEIDISNKFEIQILAIERGKETISYVSKEESLIVNDMILVYGSYSNIMLAFELSNYRKYTV
ncbi:MAG: hypothetical protein ACK5NF_01060 [Bacilli bacterium]